MLRYPAIKLRDGHVLAMLRRARTHKALTPEQAATAFLTWIEALHADVLTLDAARQGKCFPVITDDGTIDWIPAYAESDQAPKTEAPTR